MAEPIAADPTADDFLTWVLPHHALLHLRALGDEVAAREIYRRLCAGMLYAAGTPSAVKASGVADRRLVILPDWWKSAVIVQNPLADFWRTAGVTVRALSRSSLDGWSTYEYFGVRFEPNGLQRVADDAGIVAAISDGGAHRARIVKALGSVATPPRESQVGTISQEEADRINAEWAAKQAAWAKAPRIDPAVEGAPGLTIGEAIQYFAGSDAPLRAPRRRQRAKPLSVSHAEFMGWFGALPDADQAKGYRWIWAQAKLHFRPRRVPKKWATEIVKGRDLGRKPKR